MQNENELARGGTVCLTKAGLVISSTPANYGVVSASGAGIDYAINGAVHYIADTADQAMTAADAQGLLTSCLYLVCANQSEAFVTVKGTGVLNADLAAGNAVLECPLPAANTCPIGIIAVQTLASGNFTAGTTALTPAATLAVTYIDLYQLPAEPFTSFPTTGDISV